MRWFDYLIGLPLLVTGGLIWLSAIRWAIIGFKKPMDDTNILNFFSAIWLTCSRPQIWAVVYKRFRLDEKDIIDSINKDT